MNDDMNEKRREKVENFKLHISDDFPAEESYADSAPTESAGHSVDDPQEPLSRRDKIENFKLHIEETNSVGEEYDDGTDGYGGLGYEHESDMYNLNSSSILQNIDQSMIIADDDFELHSGESIQSYSANAIAKGMTPEEKSEYKKAQKADKLRLKRKSRKNRIFFRVVWFIMAALISVLLGGYMSVGINDMLAADRKDGKEVTIEIPENASLNYVTDLLASNDIIKNEGFFKLYATITKSTSGFVRGSYQIKTNLDYQAIISYLQTNTNRTDVVEVQFIEGLNIREYAELLEKNDVCSASEFLNACNSDDFDEEFTFLSEIKNKSGRYYKLEGYLFPDMYYFYKDEDVDSVIRKMLNNYEKKLYHTKSRVEGFDKRVTLEERAKAAGMTVDEVLTLASVIQAEAADVDDMYMVSSVLHNRLSTVDSDGISPYGDMGLMQLQLDSTVYYPYKSKSQIPISERNAFKSKYDTYEINGLPPGPICNPGSDAIDAALSPEESDYYFFCHKAATVDEPAQSYYARTNEEHEQNLALAGLTTRTE